MRIIRHPVLCNYYVTYRCNAKCGFCDIWELPSPYVTREQVGQNLTDLKRMGVRVIDFTGGEPLLHRELPTFFRMAKELGFITTLTTNTLLYPKHAEALRGLVDMLHFSLDSVDEQRHNASRGVDCYAHVLRSIEVAQGLGERPDILFTVTDENVDELDQVYEKFHRAHGLLVILNPLFTYNQVGGEVANATLAKLKKWVGRPGIYLNESFLTLREKGGNQTAAPMCRAASSTIVISPENKLVMPCYHLKMNELPIEGNLYMLRQSPELQALVQQEGRLPACQGCTVNCYMEPSMAIQVDSWFWGSLPSTLQYALEKWVY